MAFGGQDSGRWCAGSARRGRAPSHGPRLRSHQTRRQTCSLTCRPCSPDAGPPAPAVQARTPGAWSPLGPGAPACTPGLPPTLWSGLSGLWQREGGGPQSTESWTTGRGGQRAGKGRGQTFGFSKVKEIYFLRSRHRKWAQPQLCNTLSGAKALMTCRWTRKLVVKCPMASVSVRTAESRPAAVSGRP